MGKILKKLTGSIAVLGTALLIFSQSSFGQIVERTYWSQTFLSKEYRPRWDDRYENFGNYDMRKYPRSRQIEEGGDKDDIIANIVKRGHVTPVTYDQFGNFLLPGGEIMTMNWNRSKLGASEWSDDRWANRVFNNLMICSDEFSNWQTKFILSRGGHGAGIRSYFTPSTLKLTNFGGFRWDLSSRKNNVTLLASAGDRPIYGVHWQSVLGDILKVGATYVGRQRGTVSYSHQDIDGSNPEMLNYMKSEPQYVYVMITDDSPEDEGPGAVVYGIKAFVNGKEELIAFNGEAYPVKGRLFKINSLFDQKRFYQNSFQKQYMFPYSYSASGGPSSSEFVKDYVERHRNKRGSWLLGLMEGNTRIMNDFFHKSGEAGAQGLLNITTEMVTKDPADRFDPDVVDPATGSSGIEYKRYYKADMSSGQLEARNTDVVIYEILIPKGTRQLSFAVNVANDYCIDIIAPLTSNRQVREAGWYDRPLTEEWSGSWSVSTYDTKHCVKAPGNVKDASNQKWVRVTYDRLTGMNVYGMNMEFNWRGLFLRAEYNENNSFWSYPVNHNISGADRNEYTSKAWFINAEKDFGKWSLGTELFNYPNEYMQYWAPIDDNDDDDRYPSYDAFSGTNYASSYDNYVSYGDVDFDRYIDTTWSGVAFLDYFYDSVTVGDDFNHNGTIDSRENDSQIDLPYDRDSRGQHYFMKMYPREATIFTFGHYDVRQEYQGGRNFTRYMKFEHHQRIRGIGEFLYYNRVERRKDDYNLDEGNHNLYNDWHLTNTISTRFTMIPNVNIINNANFSTSYAVGDQLKTDGSEEENIRNLLSIYNGDSRIKRYGGYSYTLEHKADYTFRLADFRLIPSVSVGGYRLWTEKRIKEFKFMPMIKVVHSHSYSRQNNFYIHEWERKSRTIHVYPIVRFDYRVAPKTILRFGIQGFPGFTEMYRTKSQYANQNKLYDYDKRNMVFALENQTLYEGFNLLVMMGVRYSKTKYIHDPIKTNPGSTEYFITLQSEASG